MNSNQGHLGRSASDGGDGDAVVEEEGAEQVDPEAEVS